MWIYSVLHLQCVGCEDTAVSCGTRSHQLTAQELLGFPLMQELREIFEERVTVVKGEYGGEAGPAQAEDCCSSNPDPPEQRGWGFRECSSINKPWSDHLGDHSSGLRVSGV